jgi:hypothetical protein
MTRKLVTTEAGTIDLAMVLDALAYRREAEAEDARYEALLTEVSRGRRPMTSTERRERREARRAAAVAEAEARRAMLLCGSGSLTCSSTGNGVIRCPT